MSLTEEDKQWFAGHLNQLGIRLSSETERLEIGLRGELERLRSEIEHVETGLRGELERLHGELERLRSEIERVEIRLRGELERVETRLLTEFYKWASPTDARIRSHSATLRALDLELEATQDRLRKLEGERGSGPPQ